MSGPRPIDGDPSVASLRSECRGSGTLFFWARHPERSEGSPARVRRATVRRLRPRPLARDSSLRFAPFRMTWSATPAQLHPPLHCEPGGASAASRPSGPSGSAPSPAAPRVPDPRVPDARRASLPRSEDCGARSPIAATRWGVGFQPTVRLTLEVPPSSLIHGCRTHAVRPYAAPVTRSVHHSSFIVSSRPLHPAQACNITPARTRYPSRPAVCLERGTKTRFLTDMARTVQSGTSAVRPPRSAGDAHRSNLECLAT
jgi:hypothetical protein